MGMDRVKQIIEFKKNIQLVMLQNIKTPSNFKRLAKHYSYLIFLQSIYIELLAIIADFPPIGQGQSQPLAIVGDTCTASWAANFKYSPEKSIILIFVSFECSIYLDHSVYLEYWIFLESL